MAILLNGMNAEIQREIRQLLPPNVPDYIRTLSLAHPLYVGGNKTEQEARFAYVLEQYPDRSSLAAFEAAIRADLAEYLRGLQSTLDNPGYTVGILFESIDQIHRVELLEKMDKSGCPWLLVLTHMRGTDPVPPTTWDGTISSLVSLGVKHIDVGGCYLVLNDEGKIVPPNEFYSCVNNVITKLTARSPRPFQSVGIAVKATYLQPLPPK